MAGLRRLTRTMLELECYHCGRRREVPVSDLSAGIRTGRGDQVDPDVVALSPCPTCQTVTVLNRTRDTHLTGRAHRARQLINTLHARLKAAGRTCQGFPSDDRDAPNVAPDEDVIEVAPEAGR